MRFFLVRFSTGVAEIFGIAILGFGIEIELFSSEKLENDTKFS